MPNTVEILRYLLLFCGLISLFYFLQYTKRSHDKRNNGSFWQSRNRGKTNKSNVCIRKYQTICSRYLKKYCKFCEISTINTFCENANEWILAEMKLFRRTTDLLFFTRITMLQALDTVVCSRPSRVSIGLLPKLRQGIAKLVKNCQMCEMTK